MGWRIFSLKNYRAFREEHDVKSHELPPSLISLWRVVLQKHTRAWAKVWLNCDLLDAMIGDPKEGTNFLDSPVGVNKPWGPEWEKRLDVHLNRAATAFSPGVRIC